MTVYDASISTNTAIYATCDQVQAYRWIGDLERPIVDPTPSGSDSIRGIIRNRVTEIARSAAADGWDGPGTSALRVDSFARADSLIDLLPVDMLVRAELSVTPSGSLSFDWEDGRKNQLSIALSAGDTLSYASYRPEGRAHGSFAFARDQIPEDILFAIEKWKRLADKGSYRRAA